MKENSFSQLLRYFSIFYAGCTSGILLTTTFDLTMVVMIIIALSNIYLAFEVLE